MGVLIANRNVSLVGSRFCFCERPQRKCFRLQVPCNDSLNRRGQFSPLLAIGMCHSACHSLSQRLTRPSHYLKLDFAFAPTNEKYDRYFYILEGDTTCSVTSFADLGFRYVVAFDHQGMANFLKSGYSCGVSEQTTFHSAVRLGLGQAKRDARLRMAVADMEPLPKHTARNNGDIISEG